MAKTQFLQQGAALHRPARHIWQAGLLLLAATSACGQAGPVANKGAGASSANQAASGPAGRPFNVAEVASFSTPWAMDFLPGSGGALTGMALVTEKEGTLWLVDTATGAKQQVAGVPAVRVAGQGGLGDVVAHPDFASTRRVYLTFVEAGEGGSGAALGYGTLEMGNGPPRLADFKVIWRQAPKVSGNGHFSHRIAFAPDGSIFLSSGDRQKLEPAQDQNSDLGKIIHMTAEGQRIGGHHHTMGHRNVLGLAFAPDGKLWASEMGPQGGDEFNLIVGGRNYGWPKASNGDNYGGEAIPDHRAGDGFEAPKVFWDPSISPGDLLIYSGDRFPAWKGDALIPALSGEALIRVDIEGERATKADQWAMEERIRAVDQGPDGSVYLLQDKGALLRLEPVR